MRIKNTKKCGVVVGAILAILIYMAVCAVSWLFTCGLIKLITLCFGWAFSWRIATGIWLIMFLFKHVFSMGDIKTRK